MGQTVSLSLKLQVRPTNCFYAHEYNFPPNIVCIHDSCGLKTGTYSKDINEPLIFLRTVWSDLVERYKVFLRISCIKWSITMPAEFSVSLSKSWKQFTAFKEEWHGTFYKHIEITANMLWLDDTSIKYKSTCFDLREPLRCVYSCISRSSIH